MIGYDEKCTRQKRFLRWVDAFQQKSSGENAYDVSFLFRGQMVK
jgi:hypothetical protein